MLAIAKPTLTDGVGPGPPRFNQARPVDCKPDKAAGVPKAGKLRIRFNGQVVVNKTITEADTGAAPHSSSLPTSKHPSSPCLGVRDVVQKAVGGITAQRYDSPGPWHGSVPYRYSMKLTC